MPKVICIIPSRYQSSRFEGKPLADICGKPMIQHVYERASKAETVEYVAVATDDERIFKRVRDFGGNAIITSERQRAGTDRIAEAVSKLDLDEEDIVVNIQGDQPLFVPVQIDEVVGPLLEDSSLEMSTLIYRIQREEEIHHPNAVKTVFDNNHFAIYFSRATIPYDRDGEEEASYYKHHGIYAYRRSFLRTFARLDMGHLEKLEALEQLRALEHGYRIKVVETLHDSVEVDTEEEIERVRQIISEESKKGGIVKSLFLREGNVKGHDKMGREIERKFLVGGDDWRSLTQGTTYRQGYLNTAKERTVRIRSAGSRGFITVKGPATGAARAEYEYEIPAEDADAILDELCEKPIIEKIRYRIGLGKHTWEVDEFLGENAGLIIAEVELSHEDEPFERPPWLGREVTGDPGYFNSNLVRNPYKKW